MEIQKDNSAENTPTKGTPTLNGQDLTLTLTPFESDELVQALFFYESANQLELTGLQLARLESIYRKIGMDVKEEVK